MKTIYPVILFLLLFSCSLFRRKSEQTKNDKPSSIKTVVESWQTTPNKTSSKIRIISSLTENDIKRECIDKVLKARFMINTNSGFLSTEIKKIDNYYVRLNISVKDSVATFSGEYGNIGMNGTMQGEEPSASNIAWEEIKNGSKGWDNMEWLSGTLTNRKKEYNHK